MKILLIGCGAVGLGIAASLYAAGEEPDLIARGKTYEEIKASGIKRTGIFKEVAVSKDKVRVFESVKAAAKTGYDFVIVAAKTTASESIAKELSEVDGLLAESGKIVLIQNGFDNDRWFLKYFSKYAMCACSIITGFERQKLNITEVTVHSAPALIGAIYGGTGGTEPLAAAIDKGGQPCRVTEDIQKALWTKMLYNCSLNPLGALLDCNYGGLVKSENGVIIISKIIDEIYAVMEAAGYKANLATATEYKKTFFERILPPTYNHRASTLQDIERKTKTEIDSLTGTVVRLGEKYGVDVTTNKMIYNLIKMKESLYLS